MNAIQTQYSNKSVITNMQHFQKRKEWKGRGNGWERRLEVRV
jgi:hypothetical protein